MEGRKKGKKEGREGGTSVSIFSKHRSLLPDLDQQWGRGEEKGFITCL